MVRIKEIARKNSTPGGKAPRDQLGLGNKAPRKHAPMMIIHEELEQDEDEIRLTHVWNACPAYSPKYCNEPFHYNPIIYGNLRLEFNITRMMKKDWTYARELKILIKKMRKFDIPNGQDYFYGFHHFTDYEQNKRSAIDLIKKLGRKIRLYYAM